MKYKQKDLIKMVSNESGYYQGAIKAILDSTGDVLTELMSEATKDDPLSVKLFEGLNVGTKYYEGKHAMNPRTGEKIETEGHIYPCARFTQAYQLKIRAACEENAKDGE